MEYRDIANSKIADYEVGSISIDYANNHIALNLKSPKGVWDVLQFLNFEEITVTRTEPWGAGIYIAGSDLQYNGNEMVVEIELNSGDQIRIITKSVL